MEPSAKFRWVPMVVLLVMVVVPILEIWILIRLGGAWGVLPTVGVVLAMAVLGVALMVLEGRRTWRALTEAVSRGQVPAREMLDGSLVLAGGALLALPGFITDVLGLICLIPFTRPLPRYLVERWARNRPGPVLMTPASRTTVIPGEVVAEDSPGGQRDAVHDTPPALEGRIVD